MPPFELLSDVSQHPTIVAEHDDRKLEPVPSHAVYPGRNGSFRMSSRFSGTLVQNSGAVWGLAWLRCVPVIVGVEGQTEDCVEGDELRLNILEPPHGCCCCVTAVVGVCRFREEH